MLIIIIVIILISASILVLLWYNNTSKSNVSNINAKFSIKDPALKVELVAEGLDYPTSMAFLGPNDFLVLENQKGTVQRILNGHISSRPLLTVNVTDEVDR